MWQRTGTLIKDLPVSKSPHSLIQSVSVELRIPQWTRLTVSALCGAHNRETVSPGNKDVYIK